MDLLQTVRKEGSRGGRDEFKWSDVQNSNHRENYLGHSVMAPVGRWQKGRDLNWYSKADGAEVDESGKTRAEIERDARKEEIRKIKEAEEDARCRALGLPVPDRNNPNLQALPEGAEKRRIGPAQEPEKAERLEEAERKEKRRHRSRSKERKHRRSHRDRSRSRDRASRRDDGHRRSHRRHTSRSRSRSRSRQRRRDDGRIRHRSRSRETTERLEERDRRPRRDRSRSKGRRDEDKSRSRSPYRERASRRSRSRSRT